MLTMQIIKKKLPGKGDMWNHVNLGISVRIALGPCCQHEFKVNWDQFSSMHRQEVVCHQFFRFVLATFKYLSRSSSEIDERAGIAGMSESSEFSEIHKSGFRCEYIRN